ncbi:MAG: DNRLRE domain-containing protein [Myxococcota bacterium]
MAFRRAQGPEPRRTRSGGLPTLGPRPLRAAVRAAAGIAALLLAGPAVAQVNVPFSQTNVPLGSLASQVSYTVALSSLPERPTLIAEVLPDAGHPDMTLEVAISGCTLSNPLGSCSTRPPATGTGRVTTRWDVYRCILGQSYPVPQYVGKTCNVSVRATSFGSNGGPAAFDLAIRGETVVPTGTATSSISTSVQSISIPPTKDTTIYKASPTSSNGLGQSLWVSRPSTSVELRTLIAFDVVSAIPAGATIVDARLELAVQTGTIQNTLVDLYALLRNPSVPWAEGSADATGDESVPTPPVDNAATWSHRSWSSSTPLGPWTKPGGDVDGKRLVQAPAPTSGTLVLSSPELVAHVAALSAGTSVADGFLLTTLEGGAHFGSDENTVPANRPRLVVDYSTSTPVSGNLDPNLVTFVNENQNFRWIYDLDQDGILMTPVVGRCEAVNNGANTVPYTYQFQGSPSYVGLDCCTWRIDSSTGISGTGQALFFINVDAGNPANQPPDSDTDGIKNLCDNCPGVPNGPLLGSCTAGTKIGKLCRSNLDCPSGACSLAQDDLNLDGTGNACVPEPGLGASLLSGLLALAARATRRARRAGLAATRSDSRRSKPETTGRGDA